MIMPTNENTLGGTAAMQNFGIEMNESMFSMLTKNVYTDTILAVMREWSTNAVDACIAANLPIRYKVVLPTLLVPEFSVRDYGTGLSPDEVTGLFSILGASTKRTSNKFNGTFGIGRMSGLAYTDSFMIESYLHGIKYTFAVSTDSGIPQMISLGETKTSEENGLKLSIVTQQKDLKTFADKAGYLYQYFDVQPECEQEIQYPVCDKVLEGTNWYIEDTNYGHRYNGHVLIIMGNVAYQVATHELRENKAINTLLDASIRFKAPLGAVSITPGRESLSMDNKTIAYITNRFLQLKKEATNEFYKQLEHLDEGWTRAVAFNNAIQELPSSITKTLQTRLTKAEFDIFEEYNSWGTKEIILKTPLNHPGLEFYIYDAGRVTGTNFANYKDGRIIVQKHVHFMIADNRIGIKDCVYLYRQQIKNNYTQNPSPNKGYYREPIVIILKPTKWDKNKIKEFVTLAKNYIKILGNPVSFQASTIHSPTITTNGNGGVKTAAEFFPLNFYVPYNSTSVRVTRASSPIKASDTTEFYYIEMSSYEIHGFGEEKLSIYLRFLKLYYKQNPDTKKKLRIIGVPKNGMKNIAQDPRFKPVDGSLQELVPEVNLTDTSKTSTFFRNTGISHVKMVAKGALEIPEDLKEYLEALVTFDKTYHYGDVEIDTEGITTVFKCKTIEPNTSWDYANFLDFYPLLEDGMRRLEVEHLANYARLEHYKRENEKGV